MTASKIINVSSEFENVYRIETENGLILDIFEENAPKIGHIFNYTLELNNTYPCIMNGVVFGVQGNNSLVSFGGFLGSVPSIQKDREITLSYSIE